MLLAQQLLEGRRGAICTALNTTGEEGGPDRSGYMTLPDFLKSGHKPTLLSAFIYSDVSFMVWVLAATSG